MVAGNQRSLLQFIKTFPLEMFHHGLKAPVVEDLGTMILPAFMHSKGI